MTNREILFKNFKDEEDTEATELDEMEELESMDVDELLEYARMNFGVELNKYKDTDGLIDDIMNLFVIEAQKEEIKQANLSRKEAYHLAKNAGINGHVKV
jgi:hypothetical protein